MTGSAERVGTDGLRVALERLADSWSGDADFLEDGDEQHNRPRIAWRRLPLAMGELAAEAARGCAVQLREVLATFEQPTAEMWRREAERTRTAHPAALAEAQPVEPELDAERLRDAYDNVQNMNPLDYLDDGDMIDALVAEYARLTESHRAEEET